jgi:hypothetical protein
VSVYGHSGGGKDLGSYSGSMHRMGFIAVVAFADESTFLRPKLTKRPMRAPAFQCLLATACDQTRTQKLAWRVTSPIFAFSACSFEIVGVDGNNYEVI